MILKAPHPPSDISELSCQKITQKRVTCLTFRLGDHLLSPYSTSNPGKKCSPAKRQVGPSHEKMLLQNTPPHPLLPSPPLPLLPYPLRRIRRIKPDVVYLPICSLPYCKIFSPNLAPLNACFRALKVFEFEMTAIYSCEEHFGREKGVVRPFIHKEEWGGGGQNAP